MSREPRELPAGLAYFLLAAAMATQLYWTWPDLEGPAEDFDAVHFYLPVARELLAQGLAFFAQERSIHAPPLSYLYPALMGPTLENLKAANLVLSLATLVMVFRTGWLMHSRTAGAAAALLFAFDPLLRPYLAAPLTEAPFLFGCAAWLWGLAEWLRHRARWGLVASATGLVVAALTRAPIFYWLLLITLVVGALAWRRRELRALLLAYALALAVPAALIAKNAVLFDFPFYTTGGANALYLGNNPLTGGYDPTYVGLLYDVGAIARDQSHLTLEADRLLGGVTRLIFAEKDAAFFASMYARKALAFVFVTNAEDHMPLLRSWRILLVALAAAGLFAIRLPALRWAVGGMLAFQLAIHLPVLYTHRYSVGALDLWLVLAAGVGAAALMLASFRRIVTVLVLTNVALTLGTLAYVAGGRPMPDVFAAGRLLVWQSGPVRVSGEMELAVDATQWFRAWNNHVVVVELADPAGCGSLALAYRAQGEAVGRGAPPARRLAHDAVVRRYQWGAVPLGLTAQGTLRLAAYCADHAVEVKRVAIYAALGAIDYRERLLGEKPLLPVER